jgi:hypothetical protein
MTERRPYVPQPGIAARYESHCPRCDQAIHRNDRIVFSHGRPIHVACAAGADDE